MTTKYKPPGNPRDINWWEDHPTSIVGPVIPDPFIVIEKPFPFPSELSGPDYEDYYDRGTREKK